MNVPRVAALSLRRFRHFGKKSLTVTMLVSVAVVGLGLWVVLDHVYQQSMKRVVTEQWQERLLRDAGAQRARIYGSLRSFTDTAGYLANYQPLQQQLDRWN